MSAHSYTQSRTHTRTQQTNVLDHSTNDKYKKDVTAYNYSTKRQQLINERL